MVVAIGGSAGALDAVRGLIAGLPSSSDIVYILVQHLDPDHPSMLAALLVDATPFPVVEIADGMALEPDRLHVIPAGERVFVRNGALLLTLATRNKGSRLPFDFLLQSLALEPRYRVVVVVLSGNGADGSEGLRAIHEAGGHVIVQDPLEAGYDGMPGAAIATGFADAILPVAAIGAAIIGRRNLLPQPAAPDSDWIAPVMDRLRKRGHDFSGYKPGTMQRRIERRARMGGHVGSNGATALAAYIALLDEDEDELPALANDLLINVTGFFRDPDVFETLASLVIPEMVRAHEGSRLIRLWCAGCSSGEEAWSLAMLFLDEIARSRPELKLQIFATDLDPDAIATARHGIYPTSIASEMSGEHLQRFFLADDAGWRVGPALQACVVFAVHDLLNDPPFSRIDMVSCRNLLIYLQPKAQARAISLFHFALCPGGVLLLGKSESVIETEGKPPAFASVSRAERIFRRNASRPATPLVAAETGQIWSAEERSARADEPEPSLPSARLQALETELASIRDQIARSDRRATGTDPEQIAIHDDTLSRNQEYQSANEELITSQEELQSLNEELVALNGQLQETIDRQRTTANDSQNILYSTNIARSFWTWTTISGFLRRQRANSSICCAATSAARLATWRRWFPTLCCMTILQP